MVRLILCRRLGLSPEVVRARWLKDQSGPTDGTGPRRSAEPIDPHRIRLTARGSTRAGEVEVQGIATFEGDRDWSQRSETELNGNPYARETVRFHMDVVDGTTVLTAQYEILGRSGYIDFLLWLGTGKLRKERERALDRWTRGDSD